MKKAVILTLLFLTVVGIILFKKISSPQTSAIYSGQSKTWRVSDVRISTGEELEFGKGDLLMKDKNSYLAIYFKLSAHVVLKNGKTPDKRMHEYELMSSNLPTTWKSDVLDIAKMDTGWSAPIFLTDKGKHVTMKDIREIYILVQWEGEKDPVLREEKIILKPTND